MYNMEKNIISKEVSKTFGAAMFIAVFTITILLPTNLTSANRLSEIGIIVVAFALAMGVLMFVMYLRTNNPKYLLMAIVLVLLGFVVWICKADPGVSKAIDIIYDHSCPK